MSNSDFELIVRSIIIAICIAIAVLVALFFLGRAIVNLVFYPEESQFENIYQLQPSEKEDLILVINKAIKIVGNQLSGKDGLFTDIVPLDRVYQPIGDQSTRMDTEAVRYIKDFITLDVSYDQFINERLAYKNWNYAVLVFFDSAQYYHDVPYGSQYHEGCGDPNVAGKTIEVNWDKKEFVQMLHLTFISKKDIKYNHGGYRDYGGTAKKYNFVSTKDPKIHVNFITQVIDADKVKSVSDYPGHFASIEIYKESDEKNQILADDRRKKEQAEQQRQDEEKRKQQERKAEALKQLGIQE
ncbi:unnamed protein product [Commensalibacter communis]|uniref:hypothetical protein n=1 Tax=Commensalibacter communis TaxID=2972786 RepID=UPI0022FF6B2E|nr:hypothetical protein [Commensalibacter communis]CAI3944636.1 unnamed protein product [Commensalibacter communis]